MKIAILSMQKIINYGSVLQAYSLQQIVEDITGTKVDFIDIEENDLVNVNMPIKDGDDNTIPLLLDRSLLGRIKWKWMSSKRKLFKKKVEYFTKHNLNTSSTNNDKQYDIVIVGSDEVFKSQDSINLQLYGNIRQAKKKITYAASCGSAVIVGIPTETLPIIKRAMSNFSSMSVRDLGTEKYISALYDGKIYRNLDPVLVGTLYKRKHKPVPLKKYMIVYAYGTRIRKIEEIQAIKKFARKHCCGCGACWASCPRNAISMVEDEYGCKYPIINESICIKCGKCLKMCKYQNVKSGKNPIVAYAAKTKNEQILNKSASGGIFASLAYEIIALGGYVAGAVLEFNQNQKITVHHILSNNKGNIELMQGSKYVQSDAWRCYKEVIQIVKSGKQVLFCGTPCQVDAIKQITGNPDNLITIDLICHGVPPARMLQDYLKVMGKTLGGHITGFQFRDKTCHKEWTSKITIKKGKKEKNYFIPSRFVSFYKYFLESVIYRENCYTCPYANLKRVADLTIGDFWGIEQYHKDDLGRDTNGWSCVLINTKKGKDFFDMHGSGIQKFLSKAEWIEKNNHQLRHPSMKNEQRKNVLDSYKNHGYKKVEHRYRKRNGGKFKYYYRLFKEIYYNSKQ